MIGKVVMEFVNQMIAEEIISANQRDNYIYAYTMMLEKVLTIGTVCIIGLILNNLINTTLFLGFFLALRKRTGGFHANTFLKCYLGTIILYLNTFWCRYIFLKHNRLLVGMLITSICFIVLVGTVNHPNMNMDKAELSESKRMARKMVVFEGLAIGLFTYVGADRDAIVYMAMGVIICAILLFISKIIKQEVV